MLHLFNLPQQYATAVMLTITVIFGIGTGGVYYIPWTVYTFLADVDEAFTGRRRYEAGWGPMMSQTAFFIKDVIGPEGSASIVAREAGGEGQSANVEAHTRTESLRLHHSRLNADGVFARMDEWISATSEPDHFELCRMEQQFFARAILDDNDLTQHQQQAIESLAVVLAADLAAREQRMVNIQEVS